MKELQGLVALLFSLLHFGGSECSLWDIDVTFFTVNLVILGQPHVCIVTTYNYYWQPGGCTFSVIVLKLSVFLSMCTCACVSFFAWERTYLQCIFLNMIMGWERDEYYLL